MNERRRRGLGRGLGALIPSGPRVPEARPADVFFARDGAGDAPRRPDERRLADPVADGVEGADVPRGTSGEADGLVDVEGMTYAELPVEDLRPNPRQPRTAFDEGELDELAASIRSVGLLQPVVVRPAPGGESGYELVMGERRWRASRAAGLDRIPALVRTTGDDALLRDALLENLHRSDLNPLEEAAAYAQLLEDFGCTHEELATRIGRSRPQVSNTLRLLRLPPGVQRRVAAGVLSAGHARALLALADAEAQDRVAARIVAEGLSVRAVEEIAAVGEPPPGDPRDPADPADPAGAPRPAPRGAAPDPRVAGFATRLSDRLDTPVTIALGRRKGRLVVDFAGLEDLERIVGLLGLGSPGSPVDLRGAVEGSAADGSAA